MKLFGKKLNLMHLIILTVLLAIMFGVIGTHTDLMWPNVAAIVMLAPTLVLIVASVLFAWVVNPIRALIKKLKDK